MGNHFWITSLESRPIEVTVIFALNSERSFEYEKEETIDCFTSYTVTVNKSIEYLQNRSTTPIFGVVDLVLFPKIKPLNILSLLDFLQKRHRPMSDIFCKDTFIK